MANLITLGRVVLLFVTIGFLYLREPWAAAVAFGLTIFVYVSDAFDGYIARRRGRATAAGAELDVGGDGVVGQAGVLAWFAVGYGVARGAVVLWDARRYLLSGAGSNEG